MVHSPGFLQVVNEARSRVQEITVDEARSRLKRNPSAVLLDVREDHEWQAGHATEALHLSKGILERDIERKIPDSKTEVIMYCGGGFRSVLTADMAQRMGYENVYSLIGGFRAMVTDGWTLKKAPSEN